MVRLTMRKEPSESRLVVGPQGLCANRDVDLDHYRLNVLSGNPGVRCLLSGSQRFCSGWEHAANGHTDLQAPKPRRYEVSKQKMFEPSRDLTLGEIAAVSGGMMKATTGDPVKVPVDGGGAGEPVWATWTAPFWHY